MQSESCPADTPITAHNSPFPLMFAGRVRICDGERRRALAEVARAAVHRLPGHVPARGDRNLHVSCGIVVMAMIIISSKPTPFTRSTLVQQPQRRTIC